MDNCEADAQGPSFADSVEKLFHCHGSGGLIHFRRRFWSAIDDGRTAS